MRILISLVVAWASVLALGGCRFTAPGQTKQTHGDQTILAFMSLVEGADARSEMETLNQFASRRRNLQVRYIPLFESVNARLAMYKQLFQERSPQPDILEIDVIWPGMIANDLLDLTPYFGDDIRSFPAELLQTYTVQNRLIAIPLFVDGGLLYYRSDLLRKYGFKSPPATWDDLERMAQAIQQGERRLGHRDFWGYVWQGGASEALTCNALEWQASEGGGRIIEPDGTVSVCNREATRALQRAVSWIGKISPPGITAYTEDDSVNVYAAGHAAFMRNWSSVYGTVRERATMGRTGVALLPAGTRGRSQTLGGLAVAVSKYSEHRDEAVSAVRDLVSSSSQAKRVVRAGIAPTRLGLERRPDLMEQTAFHGPLLSGQVLTGLVSRPSVVAGALYDQVSKAYYLAVHSALTGAVPPAVALAHLRIQLISMMKASNSPAQTLH